MAASWRAALEMVLEDARTVGFLGPAPVSAQVRHAEAFADLIEQTGGPGVDLGSGGGVPGLVLAFVRPRRRWVLLESGQRKAEFLRDALSRLELGGRVSVVEARAEAVGRRAEHRGAYDLVVARSAGPPAVVAELGAALLGVGGELVVSDPPGGGLASRWPPGVADMGLRVLRRPAGPPAFTVLRQDRPCPERFPRRPGVPARRPWWRST